MRYKMELRSDLLIDAESDAAAEKIARKVVTHNRVDGCTKSVFGACVIKAIGEAAVIGPPPKVVAEQPADPNF